MILLSNFGTNEVDMSHGEKDFSSCNTNIIWRVCATSHTLLVNLSGILSIDVWLSLVFMHYITLCTAAVFPHIYPKLG